MMCVTSFIFLHFGTARSSENQRAMIEALAVLISQPHNTAQEQIPLASFWASLKGHSNFWTVGLTWRNYSLGFLPETMAMFGCVAQNIVANFDQ